MPCCLFWALEASHLVGEGHCLWWPGSIKREVTELGEGKLNVKGLPGGAPLYYLPEKCMGVEGRGQFRKKKKTGEYKMMTGNWELESTPLRI